MQPWTHLMRVAATLAMLCALVVTAGAAPKKKKRAPAPPATFAVLVETDPAGATVRLEGADGEVLGTTPLDVKLPAGEHTLVLQLDGHVTRTDTITVEKRPKKKAKQPQRFTFSLAPAKGTVLLVPATGAALPELTTVLVDGEPADGTTLELTAGPHALIVEVPGQPPFETWVEVAAGGEVVVEVPIVEKASGGGGGGGAMATLRAGAEIGFRQFRYTEPGSANLRPYDGRGNLHLVLDAELHPWRRWLRNRVLDRLSLRAGVGLSPVIVASDAAGNSVNAYWRSQHAGLRFRLLGSGALAIDLDAGWAHTLYEFRDASGATLDDVPDVDYQALRFGARALVRKGALEGWLGGDGLAVLSGGPLNDRFSGDSVWGFSTRAGGAWWLLGRHLELRAEAHFTRYGWSFQPNAGDVYVAGGAYDLLWGITLTAGARY